MHYRDPEIRDRIENLFSTMTVASRVATAETVAHDYISETVEGEDFKLAELLLKYLVSDVEVEVRVAVAEQVKHYSGLPRDLALQLAMDIDRVSIPVLQFCHVLTESDLIEILTSAGDARQVAIAKREQLSASVTERISEIGCYTAVYCCLENNTAEVSDAGYKHILIRYADEAEIHELVVNRPHLPEATISHLSRIVTDQLREELFKKYDVPEDITMRILANAREQALAQTVGGRISLVEKQKITRQLDADGRLTATLMLRTLIQGDFTFFTAGISQVSGISIKRVAALVSDKGGLGLKRLYERANLPPYLYPAFKITLMELAKIKSRNPNPNQKNREQNTINSIARIYNYEENLTLEKIMEKLFPF